MVKSSPIANLPYISADLPGIGGALRATPDHFVVEEVGLYEPSGTGQHLFVNLTKVGLTTKEVQKRLARIFSLDVGAIGFAGMKDKFAKTTQTFSIPVGHGKQEVVEEAKARIEAEVPVTLHWLKRHNNKLKTGHLLGNQFRITISELPLDCNDALEMTRAIVDRLHKTGVPNFFGPQRFGFNGENVARGRALLVDGKFVRDRWLRRFLISSYQSYLCNCYLGQRVQRDLFGHLLRGDVAKKYDTGGIFTVERVEEEQPRFERQEISFTAPIYGSKMRSAQDEAAQLEREIVAESGVTDEHWRRARAEGTRRLGRLLVPALKAEKGDEGSIVVEFFLPKGAFATTVLREIMKVDVDCHPV